MYPYFNGETTLYMHDATVTAIAVSSGGDPQGFNLGYRYYSLNVDVNNTTISGVASVIGAMGYGYYNSYELDFFKITNSTFVHFDGYTCAQQRHQLQRHLSPNERRRRQHHRQQHLRRLWCWRDGRALAVLLEPPVQ